jgi:hypothetical protein
MDESRCVTTELDRWIDRASKFGISDGIMKRVKDIEDSLTPFDRCLNVFICPICGNQLTFTRFSCFSDIIFKCMHPCKFIYKKKWEEFG